ncbi:MULTISPECIES: acyl-CoA carboxylase epsilon subunit [unclassified Pseudonocardia]|uniref:acyl-CoA carboxylase epsilon subunit n=1 Tax=unclassified Pseudonocardia TaxID=2619320 RepID=UPI0006CB1516|nr:MULTISPECIES: acyl-CoA carboxylase epsilon subunit [unclassified Pseudonocardia]ALE82599.1 hypothetical protein XF36_05110 [Pseudonocardia sp. HH130629-09]ANY10579.1 hypothetical protein AFB00_29675 [Pseudonocardia sp. HH130630-07]
MSASADTRDPGSRIQISGGYPDETEIAAVTLAVLASAGAARPRRDPPRRVVTWPGHGGFASPASWAGAA